MEKKTLDLYEAKYLIEDEIIKLTVNNNTTLSYLKALFDKSINSKNIKIRINDFMVLLPTEQYSGNMNFEVVLLDKNDDESKTVSVIVHKIIKDLRNDAIIQCTAKSKQLINEKKYRKAYKLLSKVKKLKKEQLLENILI